MAELSQANKFQIRILASFLFLQKFAMNLTSKLGFETFLLNLFLTAEGRCYAVILVRGGGEHKAKGCFL